MVSCRNCLRLFLVPSERLFQLEPHCFWDLLHNKISAIVDLVLDLVPSALRGILDKEEGWEKQACVGIVRFHARMEPVRVAIPT